MPVVDNLFIKLGYKYDPNNLEKFNDFAAKTGKALKFVSLASIGLATSFTLLFSKLSSNALAQKSFGDAMDVSRESIEAFSRSSEEITGDNGVASGLIEQFNGIQNALKAGESPSNNFFRAIQLLGVGLGEFSTISPDEVLLRFSESFQNLSDDSKDVVTSLLNLNTAGRNLFQGLTREGFAANIPTKADLESIIKFDLLLKNLKQSFKDATVAFGTPLFNQLIPIIDSLTEKIPMIIEFAAKATSQFIKLGIAIGEAFGAATVKIDDLIKENPKLARSITSGFDTTVDTIGNAFSSVGGFLGIGSGDTNNSTSSNSVNQNFDVNIVSDNPQAVADAIQRSSEERMSQASKNLQNPVKN